MHTGSGLGDMRNRDQSNRGAALVEMALVLPLLLMLLIGIFTVARGWQVHNVLDHAAREAARYGATLESFDNNTVEDVAMAEIAAASIDTSQIDAPCIEVGEDPCGTGTVGSPAMDQVVVQLEYPNYELNFVFFSTTIDLQSSAFARYEES